jgi:5'-methylthioadenosine phosphorylase
MPSSDLIIGTIAGRAGQEVRMVYLQRHGTGHTILPSEINFRANMWAMKKLGVEYIMASGTCGSFKESIRPGDIVIIDQFIDRTYRRIPTFMGEGVVGHMVFADPICPDLAKVLYRAAKKVKARVHKGGTYVCIEGPAFSTRAESNLYRSWGADVVGMTNLTEARLAREAEICYASIALCTDYDCWHQSEEDVTIDAVLKVMKKNIETCKKIIRESVKMLPEKRTCLCVNAMRDAIITDPEMITAKKRKDLYFLIDKYFPQKKGSKR